MCRCVSPFGVLKYVLVTREDTLSSSRMVLLVICVVQGRAGVQLLIALLPYLVSYFDHRVSECMRWLARLQNRNLTLCRS